MNQEFSAVDDGAQLQRSPEPCVARFGAAPARKGMRPSAQSLVRQLTTAGYAISSFELVSIGDYAVADADWNYKDVPHLNVVHTQVRCVIGTMDDDHITGVALQKVLGIPVPLVLVNYVDGEDSQTYYTSFGPFVLIINTTYEALPGARTKVTTRYNIGASGPARLAFPILQRIIKSNYHVLMSEDIPMRTRRGSLRSRGFSFRSDGRPRGFAETTDLLFKNVVAPERAGRSLESISLQRFSNDGDSVLIGNDDDRGLRLVRVGTDILAFLRYCDHEGAELDCARLTSGRLSCPWHAKRILPIFRIALTTGASAERDGYSLLMDEDVLRVGLPAAL
jgi:nitrite reductase/ring-hydroxylating ferredoxin subunit